MEDHAAYTVKKAYTFNRHKLFVTFLSIFHSASAIISVAITTAMKAVITSTVTPKIIKTLLLAYKTKCIMFFQFQAKDYVNNL
jgi:hypothetical protein